MCYFNAMTDLIVYIQLNGSGQPSITNELIDEHLDDKQGVNDEEIIINGAAAFFMAGADTVCFTSGNCMRLRALNSSNTIRQLLPF